MGFVKHSSGYPSLTEVRTEPGWKCQPGLVSKTHVTSWTWNSTPCPAVGQWNVGYGATSVEGEGDVGPPPAGAGGGHPGQAGLGAAGGPAVARAGQRT